MTRKATTLILTFFICMVMTHVNAQEYFKVEFDAFTPPVNDIISSVEGKPANNFMMKDLNGTDVTLSNYLGKKVILWFWEEDNTSQLLNLFMNASVKQHSNGSYLALYNNAQNLLPAGSKDHAFVILPNAAFLGEAVYDKELGTPRIYFIDETGVVKKVLPPVYIENIENVGRLIDDFFENKF
jgi:AhpC/TSA family